MIANESQSRSRKITLRPVNTKKSFVILGLLLLAASMAWLHSAQPRLAVLLVLGAGSKMVPDSDENDGDDEDECGDSVDFGSDATAEAAPNF